MIRRARKRGAGRSRRLVGDSGSVEKPPRAPRGEAPSAPARFGRETATSAASWRAARHGIVGGGTAIPSVVTVVLGAFGVTRRRGGVKTVPRNPEKAVILTRPRLGGGYGRTGRARQTYRNRRRRLGRVRPAQGSRRTGDDCAAKGESNRSSQLDSHERTMKVHGESRWRRADNALWQIWPQLGVENPGGEIIRRA